MNRSPAERASGIAAGIPAGGLFHEKSWRISPDPLPLDPNLQKRLEKLGRQLADFVTACAQLYRMSADKRQPPWIADLLDCGKPDSLIALQRGKPLANEIPRVIRPDLVLTDSGFAIAELDSVPGGIGLTAWLGETYARMGAEVLGGATGMLDGFASIFPAGDIAVSEEASTYRPEMEWLAGRLNARGGGPWRVVDTSQRNDWSTRIYRFFELFDLPNIACANQLMTGVGEGTLTVTPPFKPALEEKLWFALFWLRPLQSFWVRALGDKTYRALQEVIPYSWLLDPQPLPPHAAIPGLDVHAWEEVAAFSQKHRDLILKVSGFSENAWGSRGVVLGSDLPSTAWDAAIRKALDSWTTSPHILQRYHHPRLVSHTYWDPAENTISQMRGRVRLCPYYFLPNGKDVHFGGALATICPDDKKLLHGMTDAILVPVCAQA